MPTQPEDPNAGALPENSKHPEYLDMNDAFRDAPFSAAQGETDVTLETTGDPLHAAAISETESRTRETFEEAER